MRNFRWVTCVAAASVGMASGSRAANIDLNFNDLSTGTLAGQGGGTGASGNWAGAGSVSQVIASDLTAPSGTNFSVNQGGNPRSVQSTSGSTSSSSAAFRTLATPLTGTTWFSFLANPVDANSRIGIGINGAGNMGGTSGEQRILAVGSGLFTTAAGSTSGTFFTTGTGNLVVGQITSSGGSEELKVWVNPNVATFQSSTPTPTYDSAVLGNNAITTTGSISNLTPISYTSGGTTNGIIDNIVFSNDPNGESQALSGTVPEPSALAVAALSCVGLLRRGRRR